MRHCPTRSRHAGGSFGLLLVLCALLLRIAIPGGWMPAQGEDGLVRITMCTGMGTVEAWLDADGAIRDGTPTKQDPRTDQPCTFAGLTAPALDAAPLPFSAPFIGISRTLIIGFADHVVDVGHGLAAPPPPQTGPPAIL